MPPNVVANERGKVYAVGDAVKEPRTGLVISVTSVRFDDALPGLNQGQTWALINLTLANTSAEPITVRPLGDLGVRSEGDARFLTEPVYADERLGDRLGMAPMANSDIAPAHAAARLLAVVAPKDAKNLTLWYGPGIVLGRASDDHPPVQIALTPTRQN